MAGQDILIIGANGQLGKALQAQYPQSRSVNADTLNITDQVAVEKYSWEGIGIVLNAAAFTNVDDAETIEGRLIAWQTNAKAVANLVHAAQTHDLTIVHVSTDYVFDGTRHPHTEDEAFSPLSVYGSSKAAGDIALSLAPKHYLLRTSWVIGDGKNFVRTMLEVGKKGINPTVVADQIGRPTFTNVLVQAIDHLLFKQAAFGTYNVSGEGEEVSWADLTREIYKLAGLNSKVVDTTTAEYFANKPEAAPRPLHSTFDLSKIKAAGFTPRDWHEDLADYIKKETNS